MNCDNSHAEVPLLSPQSQVDQVKTALCQSCGQKVRIYIHGDGRRYRLSNHSLPEPDKPLLSESEWIAS